MPGWYSQNKEELETYLSKVIKSNPKGIHGIIVPHAGYSYSGEIAGKGYSLIGKINKAVVLGPTHSVAFFGLSSIDKIQTPLGELNIINNNFQKLQYEHSVDNQIPFLQKINPQIEILPLVVGEIRKSEAIKIAEKISDFECFIFSTDLSHFLPYDEATKADKNTIEIIENLDEKKFREIDACGKNVLMILFELCKLKNWKPKLIEYKNSGDITGEKSSVVGYASFYF